MIPLLTVILCSCVLYGSGIRTIPGTLKGTVPANAKVGLFARDVANTFIHDSPNNTDEDIIYRNLLPGDTTGSFTPIVFVSPSIGDTYTITFPNNPSTVKYLVAWDDLNADNIFDLGTEQAFLPVKTINSVDNVIHHFSYLEIVEVITYIAVYSVNTTNDSLRNDNFDAFGNSGIDFNFD